MWKSSHAARGSSGSGMTMQYAPRIATGTHSHARREIRSPSQKLASRIAMSGWVFCRSSVSMKWP